MEEESFITSKEAEEARQQELHFVPQRTDIKAPHFVMYVKELLIQKYGFRQAEEDGLQVITSLDLDLQNHVQKIVSQEVAQLERLHITNGAALVTRPNTGEVLAMVGSRDYFDLASPRLDNFVEIDSIQNLVQKLMLNKKRGQNSFV